MRAKSNFSGRPNQREMYRTRLSCAIEPSRSIPFLNVNVASTAPFASRIWRIDASPSSQMLPELFSLARTLEHILAAHPTPFSVTALVVPSAIVSTAGNDVLCPALASTLAIPFPPTKQATATIKIRNPWAKRIFSPNYDNAHQRIFRTLAGEGRPE